MPPAAVTRPPSSSTTRLARAGEAAGFPFQISSHVLRHSCGYKLANDGRDTRSIQHYLGHRSIASTVRYTALAPDRFKDFLERLRKPHQRMRTAVLCCGVCQSMLDRRVAR